MLTPSLNAATDPLAALLDGVTSIGATGSTGAVVVLGDHAWPLLVGNADKAAALRRRRQRWGLPIHLSRIAARELEPQLAIRQAGSLSPIPLSRQVN
jgi:hypothetical protein